uniref:FH2 domain-containing protein n=1 Tax=Panagrellus redivivus TaxID=6233 RepID=A0A7E4UZE5_PANRE
MGGAEPGETGDTPVKKSLLGRLRARSRSMANVHRDRGSNNNNGSPMSKLASGMFGGLFSRKRPTPVTPETNNGALETAPTVEDTASLEEATAGTTSVVPTANGDRFLSASHSNLNTVHPEMDVDAYEGTSKMPSYVNISLAANGYSRSRTNLNNVLSRSGDVHNLIVNGSEVTDLTKEFKAVVFVSDKKNMVEETLDHTKTDSAFILPELKVEAENVQTFENLTTSLEKQLFHCVELSDKKLADPKLNEDAKEAILAASGHTRILLKSKVKKMFQLLEKHQEAGGSETVTINDLACFWMMLDIEVGRIREQFDLVEKYRLNDWQPLPEGKPEVKPLPPPSVKRPPGTKFTPKITPKVDGTTANKQSETPRPRNDMKAFLAQRRKELAEKNGANGDANNSVLQ